MFRCAIRLLKQKPSQTEAHSLHLWKPQLNYRAIATSAAAVAANAQLRQFPLSCTYEEFPERVKTIFDDVMRLRHRVQELNGEKNALNKQAASMTTEEKKLAGQRIKSETSKTSSELDEKEALLHSLCLSVCNDTHPDVAKHISELPDADKNNLDKRNRVVFILNDDVTTFGGNRGHDDIMETRGWVDFQAGRRASGHRGYILRDKAVALHSALISHAMNVAMAHGFTPIHAPALVRREVAEGCGFAARDSANRTRDMYEVDGSDGLVLSATGEIPLAALHANSQLPLSKLPLLYVGLSQCYRPEAGNSGRNAKGLYRVHEFTKLELFAICTPIQSDALLDRLVDTQRAILAPLGLRCRGLDMAPEELGASAYRKYDIECFWPGNAAAPWGELTSASNCRDYQARRLLIRYVDETGLNFAHTLNATAMALPRTLAAVIETCQTADGEGNVGVRVPEVLSSYLGGATTL
eukprot:PhM_4_TR5621/c0_g1_i1/m.62032/K01875/SARS, serS; seryl-tRNA synthetase